VAKISRPLSLRDELRAYAAIAAVATTGLGFAVPANAEDASDPPRETETVVVTATRPEQNPYADPEAPYRILRSASGLLTEELQDVPKAITVIPDTVIDDLGATSFRDLFRAQPGVTLGTGEGGNAFGGRIFIRGFDARNDVYVDGVRDPGVGSREVFAVQQIEVLRGPSGAFGGRGTTGGSVSLVTKQPGEGSWGDAEVTVGTDDTRRMTVDVNREITDDLAIRFNGMYHESGVAGRDYVFNNRWGWALAVAYTPTDDLRIGFDAYHMASDYLPDWGHPYDTVNNEPFNVRRENYYGVLARDFGEAFADVYTASIDYSFSDNAKIHSILRYGQSKNAYTASAPEQPNTTLGTVGANAKRRDALTDYWAHQTSLTLQFATGGIEHALVVGYDLSKEEVLNRTRAFTECATLPCTGTAANPRLDLYNPDPTIPFGRATAVTGRPIITTETAAIYAIDTLKFSPQWEALFGVRADRYSADTTGLTPTRSSESEYVNWHAGVSYKPFDYSTLYVSYGSSSNPPCEQLDAFALDYGGCDQRVVTLDPVRNTSLEAGAKFTLFGHLNANAALFQIERTGVAVQNGAAIGEQDQEVIGIELTLAGAITERWSVFGGLSAFDTEVTASPVAAQVGGKFPNVSETSFTLTSRHQITDRLHFGGTATYGSEKYGGSITAGSTKVSGYTRYDLFGGFEIS